MFQTDWCQLSKDERKSLFHHKSIIPALAKYLTFKVHDMIWWWGIFVYLKLFLILFIETISFALDHSVLPSNKQNYLIISWHRQREPASKTGVQWTKILTFRFSIFALDKKFCFQLEKIYVLRNIVGMNRSILNPYSFLGWLGSNKHHTIFYQMVLTKPLKNHWDLYLIYFSYI